jgi:hypothetical protein
VFLVTLKFFWKIVDEDHEDLHHVLDCWKFPADSLVTFIALAAKFPADS